MGGDVDARFNAGILEWGEERMDRALKHLMIAAKCGDGPALEKIREFYMTGDATKDDYRDALRSHQVYLSTVNSREREEATAQGAGVLQLCGMEEAEKLQAKLALAKKRGVWYEELKK